MSEFIHRFVKTNGIRMHLVEAGQGYPVVFCHGFPELWYSWRHQLRALSEAGFRAIAPDQRGYGETDCPQRVEDYRVSELVADIVGMLDALKIETCAIVGHDWGGFVVWHAAMRAPGRIARVAAINTPFMPRWLPSTPGSPEHPEQVWITNRQTTPTKPTEMARQAAAGNFHHVLYFQQPGVAEAELEGDVRRSLRGFFSDPRPLPERSMRQPPGVFGPAVGGLLDRFTAARQGSYMSDDDLEVFVKAFKRTGFRGGLNWYRNVDGNWEESAALEERVNQPSLMITAELDPVLWPEQTLGMERWVPNFKRVHITGSGHWTQQEKPAEVNAALLEFLAGVK
ncbi:MAG TPA: alpha/beta hydrolase [Candidatus Binataceae bacterium]|nr:alpha/beta hydrolase [Candidatus Binataceae bacterium]